MASLEESQPFDPRVFFHGQPCPRCQARLLDKRNFREMLCRPDEKAYLLKCLCSLEPVIGLVYGPETAGEYLRRPSAFLVSHTGFYCPACKRKPKAASWFISAGTTGRGYEMLTLQCQICKKSSSLLVSIREIHRDPLPPELDELDLAPDQAVAAGPLTADDLLEFDQRYSDEDLWQALLQLPRVSHSRLLPPRTETRPEKKS